MSEAIGRIQFLRFLEERELLSSESLAHADEATRQFREAPAAIALRHHMLDPDEVDVLIAAGADSEQDILAIAEQQNLISAESRMKIRTLQNLHEILEICEVLVLDGTLDGTTIQTVLAAFLSEQGLGKSKS